MSVLGRFLHDVRVWMGFADATESHLTPSHGWLLPSVADARAQRVAVHARQAAAARNGCV